MVVRKNFIEMLTSRRKNYKKINDETKSLGICPFCNKHGLLEETIIKEDPIEQFLWLPNRYPANKNMDMTLIIEGNDCEYDFHEYRIEKIAHLLKFSEHCYEEFKERGNYQDILLFKQFGKYSGGTVRHGHLQLVGLYEKQVNDELIKTSLLKENNHSIYKNKSVELNYNLFPVGEHEAFNLIYKRNENLEIDVSKVLRLMINYIIDNGSESYSLAFYINEDDIVIQIKDRYISSTFNVHYGIKSVFEYEEKKINELKKYILNEIEKL